MELGTAEVGRPRAVNATALLAVVAVAQFMIILDASVVNVALPTIQDDLGFSQKSLSWVLNSYTLMFGGFLLLAGRLADEFGRRRLFMTAISLFVAASLVCGFSESATMLVLARGLQGLAGAMVSPAALAIILTTFAEGSERNRALAVWGAVAGAGGAVGLVLGGTIVQALSWRWVFFINVPIGAVVLSMAPRSISESRARSAGAARGYDIAGAATMTLGTMALVFTLINADGWGWASARTLIGFAVAAALIVCLIAVESRNANPLLPLRIFANRSLAASDATMLVLAAGLFGMFFFCSLYLQQVLSYGALRTGFAFLPLSVCIIGASALASKLVDRFTPKPVLTVGLLLTIAGFLLLVRITGHSDYGSHMVPAMIVLGGWSGNDVCAYHDRRHQRRVRRRFWAASGLLNTTQQVGGSLGLAIMATVASTRSADALRDGSSASAALTHGFRGAFAISAALCTVGVLVGVSLLPRPHRTAAGERPALVSMSIARCPGAPFCGHLARVLAVSRGVRRASAVVTGPKESNPGGRQPWAGLRHDRMPARSTRRKGNGEYRN